MTPHESHLLLQVAQDTHDIKEAMWKILDHLYLLETLETTEMSLLDDAAAAEDAALAKINANTDALSSVKAALDAQTAKIADLTAQLAAAGTDPAAIQAVLDKANAILAATDTQATAEAALTNTPAAALTPAP